MGGITNCWNTSTGVDLHGGKIYLCTNLRMIALDQRMPGRVCAQMMLYPNPSYSSKVAVPSGLAFCSTYTETNEDPSRLDYVAAWWPYSNSNTANAPAAMLGCFEQSYKYCSCHLPSMADRMPPLQFGEDCLNSDHSRIERAPTVVRGMPLRIAGPLTSVDFSNQPCIDRLSLPWTGLVMTTLGADAKSGSSPLSILASNVVGDIFLTDLTKENTMSSEVRNEREVGEQSMSYYWPSVDGYMTLKDTKEEIEKLREVWIENWWKEQVSENKRVSPLSLESSLHLSHMKTARCIYQLEPMASLSSPEADGNKTKLEQKVKTKKEKKEKRPPGGQKKVYYGPKNQAGRRKKILDPELPEDFATSHRVDFLSCKNLKVITPEDYVVIKESDLVIG